MDLEDENHILKRRLDEREIKIAEAGSIADAAVMLTEIFKNAQDTADLYVNEVMRNSSDVKMAEARADKIIENAKKEAHKIKKTALKRTNAMLKAASARFKEAQKLYMEQEERKNSTNSTDNKEN